MLDEHTLTQLAEATGLGHLKIMRRAAHFALPVVLENMGNFSRTTSGPATMLDFTRSTDEGQSIASQLFGGRLPRAAEQLAQKAGIDRRAGLSTLRAVSSWVLESVSQLADNDPQKMVQLLAHHGGYGQGVAPDTQPPSSNNQPVAAIAAAKSAHVEREPHVPETRNQSAESSASLDEVATASSASNDKSATKLIAACVAALLVLGGIAFAVLGGGGTSETADSSEAPPAILPNVDPAPAAENADEQNDETSAPIDDDEPATAPAPEVEPASDTTNVAAPPAAASGDPALVQHVVPMRDINGVSPTAGGTVDFTFNKLTGEICFDVGSFGVEPPYAAHIHAGDFGVKGGVVADLGLLEDGATGCVDNLPADTRAILAQPSRHYAELHDAGGEWTVRGQLSETTAQPGIVPLVIPLRDILGTSPNSSGVLSFEFNTQTGEICYSVLAVGVSPPFNSHIHAGPFGIKGGVVLDLGGLDSGNSGCVPNDLADTLAILADPGGHYAELHDAGGEWTVRGQLTETVDNPGVVSLAVPMVDIQDVEPSAEGMLKFDFDTVSGEICYDVSAVNITAPFDAHIHAGEYGVKGGVVLDLGGLEDGSGGCVRNAPGDTLAILADLSGHYAELHDAGGEWTIRGQLSEATAPIDADSVNLLQVDTSGGGASLRLEDGTIYLDGEVDTQAVADEMAASLAGISTPVVNNLSVVPGSPAPSGRVIIGDNAFFDTGSDQVKSLRVQTVAALVELAESRPDWVMTIVGHTDNIGTDVYNLELSLRRAQALRDVLVTQGMNSDNMRIRGAGETAPIADNSTETGRAQNRRIEFEFTPA